MKHVCNFNKVIDWETKGTLFYKHPIWGHYFWTAWLENLTLGINYQLSGRYFKIHLLGAFIISIIPLIFWEEWGYFVNQTIGITSTGNTAFEIHGKKKSNLNNTFGLVIPVTNFFTVRYHQINSFKKIPYIFIYQT